jgi:hypothetical protein
MGERGVSPAVSLDFNIATLYLENNSLNGTLLVDLDLPKLSYLMSLATSSTAPSPRRSPKGRPSSLAGRLLPFLK